MELGTGGVEATIRSRGETHCLEAAAKHFNEIRREQFPWTWDVTKNASDQPILDSGKAFTAFFEGRARRPRFKSKVTGACITKTADWWVSRLTVEMPEKRPAAVGIDVGLNRLATLSTGEGVENQAFLKTALKKLCQANNGINGIEDLNPRGSSRISACLVRSQTPRLASS